MVMKDDDGIPPINIGEPGWMDVNSGFRLLDVVVGVDYLLPANWDRGRSLQPRDHRRRDGAELVWNRMLSDDLIPGWFNDAYHESAVELCIAMGARDEKGLRFKAFLNIHQSSGMKFNSWIGYM